jgi:hypothetical protein
MKRSRSFLTAWAIVLVATGSLAQNMGTMTPAQAQAAAQAAQAAGQSFGNATMTSGPTMPSNIANQGMAPGANNIMGNQYTGTADPALMGLSQNPSLVNTGQAAKSTSVNGFGGYSNTPADQGNQAAYFVTTTPIPIVKIQPTDSISMTAAAPAVPAGIASSTSQICHTTVTNLPFDPSIQYTCNETYNQYNTSCSLDKSVFITTVRACNVAIARSTMGGTTQTTVNCSASGNSIDVNLGTITGPNQCHGGGCNSDYFDLTMTITPGFPVTVCPFLNRVYTGVTQNYVCAAYDGVNTISITPISPSYTMIGSVFTGGGRNGGGWQAIYGPSAVYGLAGGYAACAVPVPVPDVCTTTTSGGGRGGTPTTTTTCVPGIATTCAVPAQVVFSGGVYQKPILNNNADVNNCTALNGLL